MSSDYNVVDCPLCGGLLQPVKTAHAPTNPVTARDTAPPHSRHIPITTRDRGARRRKRLSSVVSSPPRRHANNFVPALGGNSAIVEPTSHLCHWLFSAQVQRLDGGYHCFCYSGGRRSLVVVVVVVCWMAGVADACRTKRCTSRGGTSRGGVCGRGAALMRPLLGADARGLVGLFAVVVVASWASSACTHRRCSFARCRRP